MHVAKYDRIAGSRVADIRLSLLMEMSVRKLTDKYIKSGVYSGQKIHKPYRFLHPYHSYALW